MIVHASVAINPATAALTITTGPLPQIIDGVPLRLRTLNVTLDRGGFILNPTNCVRQSVTGTATGVQGTAASISTPFTATGCKSLKFTPKLTASTRANGELAGHGASLHLAITTGASAYTSSAAPTATSAAEAQTNTRSLKIDLPQRLPARLETIQKACPEVTFDQNLAGCPKASVVGSASVQTPILSTTMTGPAYLVAKSGSGTSHPGESKVEKEEAAFPDLVLVLQGEGVRIDHNRDHGTERREG